MDSAAGGVEGAGGAVRLILPLIWVWTITTYGTARFDPQRAQVAP
ncbi:hypothetical protein [Micromonospora rosaria]|nr:hypothetical protein [Micromonospora rosaria]